ncbi:hypothetical protein Ciccas_001912 [Cichlidogyrus casuarinus]|uniref:Nucleoside diphosphate kinase-like domain-containing protein n=1 Tax=Cichlidogyrus casuarinus TaxID=1844966 RepID=A0ABD2QJ20_9PLAT
MLKNFAPEFQPQRISVHRPAKICQAVEGSNDFKALFDKEKNNAALLVIRPSVNEAYAEEPIKELEDNGFEVIAKRIVTLKEEAARNFYKNIEDPEYKEAIVQEMVGGPCYVLILKINTSNSNSYDQLKELLGENDMATILKKARKSTIRARFLTKSVKASLEGLAEGLAETLAEGSVALVDGFHLSELDELEKDFRFFFPAEAVCLLIKPDVFANAVEIRNKITDTGLEIVADKELSLDESAASIISTNEEGVESKEIIAHITSGPSVALILRGEEAGRKIACLVGPSDPDIAAESEPNR